jgi:hypothetical protein
VIVSPAVASAEPTTTCHSPRWIRILDLFGREPALSGLGAGKYAEIPFREPFQPCLVQFPPFHAGILPQAAGGRDSSR